MLKLFKAVFNNVNAWLGTKGGTKRFDEYRRGVVSKSIPCIS